ncbi:MAG: hypothetical protein JJU11_06150 [Candidatus Sumerlaeia bacterium]|nr:hypothetical protein [Candidatus Sumerlaeia bacterium]
MKFEELEVELGEVRASVAPARGALVTRLEVGGHSILYMDRKTFENPSLGIRGGIPIMFPFCGKLKDGRLNASGTELPMHGFARNASWKVIEHRASSLHLRMETPQETRDIWPWDFTLDHRFILTGRGIHLEMSCVNEGDKPMPLAPGWHPYFPCSLMEKENIAGSLPGTEPGHLHDKGEVNFGVRAPADGVVRYQVPGLPGLRLEFSPGFRHFQIWSLSGRDFVCLEPFWGAPNSINEGGAVEVQPGEGVSFWFRIEI